MIIFKKVSVVLFFMILVFGTLLIPSHSVAESTSILIEQASSKRDEFGFSTDRSVISGLIDRDSFSKEFGFYLSPTEEKQLETRITEQEQLIRKITELVQLSPQLKDNYLGMYIDQSKGGDIYIGFRKVESSDKLLNTELISKSIGSSIPIHTYEALYTEEELDKAANTLSKNIYELNAIMPNIQYVNVDYIGQKIQIGVKEYTADHQEQLLSHVRAG